VNGKSGVRELGAPLGEPERSGGAANGDAAIHRVPSAAVPEQPQRRRFTPAYKVRIVEEAEACTQPGEIGALLRREGLYSSHLGDWRREYRAGAVAGLGRRPRGPQGPDPVVRQKEELEQQVARLQHRLRQAEKIIEVQKKVSELLGIPLTEENER